MRTLSKSFVGALLLGLVGVGEGWAQGFQEGPVGLARQIPPAEYAALVSFAGSAVGVSTKGGWLDPDAPSWQGVTVEGFNADEQGNVLSVGYVAGVMLPRSGLSGEIGGNFGYLTGLRALDLSGNALTGEVPQDLATLQNLQNLELGGNRLTGGIPANLGELRGLEFLDLSTNLLSGEVPAALRGMANLRELKLSGNFLSGDFAVAVREMQNLGWLDVRGNYFGVELGSANRGLIEQMLGEGKTVKFEAQNSIGLSVSVVGGEGGTERGLEISFVGLAGQKYALEWSADLREWHGEGEVISAGGETGFRATVGDGAGARVYRVLLVVGS